MTRRVVQKAFLSTFAKFVQRFPCVSFVLNNMLFFRASKRLLFQFSQNRFIQVCFRRFSIISMLYNSISKTATFSLLLIGCPIPGAHLPHIPRFTIWMFNLKFLKFRYSASPKKTPKIAFCSQTTGRKTPK